MRFASANIITMKDDGRLVYSTDGSLPIPQQKRSKKPASNKKPGAPPDDGIVRVGCERRRGGSVTQIHGLPSRDVGTVASELRRALGTGGTVKSGVVELQGDRRDAVIAYFDAHRPGQRTRRM